MAKNKTTLSLKEIYQLEPKTVTNELYPLEKHLGGVEVCGLPDQARVELRYYANVCFDGRRTWELFSVWFDGKPVMLCQNAGREGDDHAVHFITDSAAYKAMVIYIRSLVEPEEPCQNVFDEDCCFAAFTEFYGHSLSEMYDPTFVPELKPGDTLMVEVNEASPRGYWLSGDKTIMTEVEVLDVDADSPYAPYRVKETQRVMKYGFKLQPQKPDEPMVVAKDRFKDWKKRGYDEIYHRLSRDLRIRS